MNNYHPLVSIITPSFNQAPFLETTICSVLEQTYDRIEYILIDGGSKDGSLEIIKRYHPDLAYWISEPDQGQAQAINKGLRQAHGEILGWLNSDDVLAPDAVSRVVAHFFDHPDIDLVYGQVERIDSKGSPVTRPKLPSKPPLFGPKTMLTDRYIVQPGSLWRRQIMEKAGLLDESYHFAMDLEYWIRLVINGAKFARLEGKPLANFRLSKDSKTRSSPEKFAEEELRILSDLEQKPDLPEKLGMHPAEFRRYLRQAIASTHLRLALNHSASPGHFQEAWLISYKALQIYPPIVIKRWKWFLIMLRGLIRTQKPAINPHREINP